MKIMRIILEDSDLRDKSLPVDFLSTVGLNDFKISVKEISQANEIVYHSYLGGFDKLLKNRNGVDYGREPAVPEKPKLNSRYDLLKGSV